MLPKIRKGSTLRDVDSGQRQIRAIERKKQVTLNQIFFQYRLGLISLYYMYKSKLHDPGKGNRNNLSLYLSQQLKLAYMMPHALTPTKET